MKESIYKSYDELPLFLNAKTVQRCWACHRPVVTNGCTNWASQCCVGGHMVVPKEQFIRWVSDHTGGGT